jgi:hypothetical protein
MRRMPPPSSGAIEQMIRGLMADRKAIRAILNRVETLDEFPVVTHDDGSKWVEKDWLVAQLKDVLP